MPPIIRTRRNFLTSMGGTAAALALSPLIIDGWPYDRQPSYSETADPLSYPGQNKIDPRVAAIVSATPGIDAHNHIDVPLSAEEAKHYTTDLKATLTLSGLSAICMTFAVDYQKLTETGQAWERFNNGLDAMDSLLRQNKIKRSLNLHDLRKAHKQHKPTVIQSVEGGHFLEGNIDRLEKAWQRGLRHLTLLHDNDASVPLGDVFTNPPRWNGLTGFGADVIKECNRLGILVDLGHASADTVTAALRVSNRPVIVSHTGLDTRLGQNENMARMMKPRLISKEQAMIIAAQGGVIGVWAHLADTTLDYAANIRAMVDVAGIDHVCIGTDTKLSEPYRRPQPDQRTKNDPDASKPNRDDRVDNNKPSSKPRIGERTNLAFNGQDTGFYYAVVDALLKTGFTEAEIAKIGGENFCRVFDAATSPQ